VGAFHLESKLEKTRLRAGDGTTLTLVLDGTGQPQASGFPVWQAPAGVETYPPQDEWTRVWKAGTLWTRLVRRIVLVPRNAGTVPLDSVRFSWFDPSTAKFNTAVEGLAALAVDPAPPVVGMVDTAALRGRDPRLTKVDKFWILFGKGSALLWSLLLAAAAGFGIWRWIQVRLSPEYGQRKALQILEKRLSTLTTTLPAPKWAAELHRILETALAVRVGEEARAWTSEEIPDGLVRHLSWSEERSREVGAFALELLAAQFAGEPLPPDGRVRLAGILRELKPGRKASK